MHEEAEGRFGQFCRGFFRWAERLKPAAWARKHIRLPPARERQHGAIDFTENPYLQEPLDSLAEPGITDIAFVAPTRFGKTFIIRMGFCYFVASDPSPMMLVDSTLDKGRGLSKKELIPLVEYNKILRDKKPKGKDRHDFATTRMLFPGASLDIYGANSPAQVSGDTVRVVFANECDKYQGATDEEASIFELIRHRTESFEHERIHLYSSTPTLETGNIWVAYLRGDQRKWFVPMPCCGEAHVLEWDQVKFDKPGMRRDDGTWDLDQVKEGAEYECPHCKTRLSNAQVKAAVLLGEWRPTAKGEPGWRSYHITGICGPLSAHSLGALAVDFLAARNSGFFFHRQDFWNSRWGQPWRDDVSDLTQKVFAGREGDYLRGTVPDGWVPDVLIMGVDVQTYGMPWVLRALKWSGESYLVDHGMVPAWSDLDVIQADYGHLAESYVICDIRFEDRAAEAKEQVYTRGDRGWLAYEGHDHSVERVKIEETAVYIGGALAKDGPRILKLVTSNYDFKLDLEKKMAGEVQGWFTYQLPLTPSESEYREQVEYYKQMLDERRIPRKKKLIGKPPYEFKSRTGNNHANDCETQIEALFWVLVHQKSFLRRQPAKRERKVVEVKR